MPQIVATISGIQIEGNLINPDLVPDLLAGEIKGQSPENFGLEKSDKLADEIALAWGDAKAYWSAFQRALARLAEDDPATSVTREQWAVPLLMSLGYKPVYTAKAEVIEGQTYAISHRTEKGENKPPIHIVGCRVGLEERPPSGTPRLSAHALVQEYLNRTEHLWAIATNGLRWRLLRDSSLMTRLTYIEFDLEQILEGENFAEFGLFYRLFHRSRLPETVDDADECLLEFYHQESLQQGGRVRDRLRDGVEDALKTLGTGFLQHPANQGLREQLDNGTLTDVAFYRQLLRLIYRLLFLMVAESRNLLLSGEDVEKVRIYREYYSIERLRALAERPSWRREGFQDLWQGLRVTFRLFDENWRGQVLGLSPLNGDLFGSRSLLDIDSCAIDNHDLMLAIRKLSLYEQRSQLRRVNYGALDVEELGSIYESLLDFHPLVSRRQGVYEFLLVTGSDRKTTGSYYTPPELVGQLIKSALEPVIGDRLQSLGATATVEAQEQALLKLKICDPACGSGHFLLAAARRIGKELARIRTGEAQPGPEPLRKAIRDVIQHCIYGVDLNPLAVDLCKVALWIEGLCQGNSLNFLDHRIKCGNSLVGVLDLDCLQGGIPDGAYKPVTGDDKSIASERKKINKKEREDNERQQLTLFESVFEQDRQQYAKSWRELEQMKDDDPATVRQKQEKYERSRHSVAWLRDRSACNLWTAAFFMPLTQQNLQLLPTSAALQNLLRGNWTTQAIVDAADRLAEEKRFFHWPLEYPEVFEQGGFDCVLGNPPWERIKLTEKEFFAARDPDIANAKNKTLREKLIKALEVSNAQLAKEFSIAKHDADAQNKFIREAYRFPLTATGDINTYAVFAETARSLTSKNGFSGLILPVGIATDNATKNYFGSLIEQKSLVSLIGFENESFIFSEVHHAFKFCILTYSGSSIINENADFIFFCRNFKDVEKQNRHFSLSPTDIRLLNPDTLTCPIFRTSEDAELTKKIYRSVPSFWSDNYNSWGIQVRQGLFHLTNDSKILFNLEDFDPDTYDLKYPNCFVTSMRKFISVYEGKMIQMYNHRAAGVELIEGKLFRAAQPVTSSSEQLLDPNFLPAPQFWVDEKDVLERVPENYKYSWAFAYKDITASTNERTCVVSVLPNLAASYTLRIGFVSSEFSARKISCLIATLSTLVFDYLCRQSLSGLHLSDYIMKQLPVIQPDRYTQTDIDFIAPRVLELTYTAWDMQPFAQDMGYDGEPFIWDRDRRALLRAELDAYYAHLYGLTRDELRYILDPADVYGPDFPSETFRVLKNNEIKQFGEYRTQRLVLAAWDRLFGKTG